MQRNHNKRSFALLGQAVLWAALVLVVVVPGGSAYAAPTETVLHSFTGDGADPKAALIADSTGNLYGTTRLGGPPCGPAGIGCGTAFKLSPGGTETVLYDFCHANCNDGALPVAGLIADSKGNLYGTNQGLGCFVNFGCGVVFKLSPDGTYTVLYSFTGGSDGAVPAAGLIADSSGNLYGTTSSGGASGNGVVFKLSPDGTETVLHSFTGSDGSVPVAGLIADSSGNLYGTTSRGGASGNGVVFKLSPEGTETVLHSFTGGSDGANPQAGLIADSSGNLYGTTSGGGASGNGVVFKLSPAGTETVLHSFTRGYDGANPQAGLIADSSGNLYGTTSSGGGSGCAGTGCGTVFKVSPGGSETVLYSFTGGSDGAGPAAGLIADNSGNLYGTTAFGGTSPELECGTIGCGVVFKLSGTGFVTAIPFATFSVVACI